ncbi:kappaPI-actitoxin-Avd3c [Drosophila innubila]|uniref:kappaPI-actitoxin-Avd3c n=1 Tax=Drosophila innubila TaxID=198719 RepID=UPI00148BE316|nr:kappaPI-actitoxin-Avd3c [Drosophila innubila]
MLLKTTSLLLIVLLLLTDQGNALDARCLQPVEVGPCRARIIRWYYNKNTKTCEQFGFGGCHGNQNNFMTLRSCRKVCS